jgi:hypothetical protein
MTADENILSYLLTLLQTVPDAEAFRSREAPVDKQSGTVILLCPEEAPAELRSSVGSLAIINFGFLVTIVARGDVPDSIADPVRQAMHSAVMADRTLGGRCALLMLVGTKWDFDKADGTAVAVEMRYVARYQANANDLSIAT